MSILPHTIAGAVAGSFFTNPLLAALAGGVSHFVLDFIPHFDPDIRKTKKMAKYDKAIVTSIVVFETITALVILSFFINHTNILLGGLAGPMVDVDNFLQYARFNKRLRLFPLLSKLGITAHEDGSRLHNKLSFKNPLVNFFIGSLLQAVIFFGGLIYLYARVT